MKAAYKAGLEEGGWIIAENDRKTSEDKDVTSKAWWIERAERTSHT